MKILVTGGAGYIGSHTCVELLNEGYDVHVIDNLSNSSAEGVKRVQEITGRSLEFSKVDLLDKPSLTKLFEDYKPDAVIHFAGLKAVGESVSNPLLYHQTNVIGTLNLLDVMRSAEVKKLIFSSSATVYGDSEDAPFKESDPIFAVNPYGQTKIIIELMLGDISKSDPEWQIIPLRYFNPVGAHPSGLIGEDPRGIPNNLFPYVSQVAVGKLPKLHVYGNDYPTPDGTCIRDYLHVVDLATGHVSALKYLEKNPGLKIFNLGTGKGKSVLEVVAAFSRAINREIPYEIGERRPGDAAVSYADVNLANTELGWKAERDLDEMCADAWKWQSANPEGYGGVGEANQEMGDRR